MNINLAPTPEGYRQIATRFCCDIVGSARKNRRDPVANLLSQVILIAGALAQQQRSELVQALSDEIAALDQR